MKVSIIPEDSMVIIDGVAKSGIDLSSIDPSYHAIQWYGDRGEIEVYDGHTPIENRPITSLDEFQFAIDAWNSWIAPVQES